MVTTDFSKAFDMVDHNILIKKLISMGTRPSLITWIASFLSGREQCVRYRGELSEWKTLHGGVPQGTLIEPLGFLALINDAVTNTPLNTVVETNSRNSPCSMQNQLDQFEEWVELNHMKLNNDKCSTIKVSFLRRPILVHLSHFVIYMYH